MPTYEYKCDECAARFDRRQSFSDDPITVCPSCGGRTRRVIHAPAVVFKGSGFYKTDSRPTSSGDEAASAEKPAAEKPADGAAAKPEGAAEKAAEAPAPAAAAAPSESAPSS